MMMRDPITPMNPDEQLEEDTRVGRDLYLTDYYIWRNGAIGAARRGDWGDLLEVYKEASDSLEKVYDLLESAIDKTEDPELKKLLSGKIEDLEKIKNLSVEIREAYYAGRQDTGFSDDSREMLGREGMSKEYAMKISEYVRWRERALNAARGGALDGAMNGYYLARTEWGKLCDLLRDPDVGKPSEHVLTLRKINEIRTDHPEKLLKELVEAYQSRGQEVTD